MTKTRGAVSDRVADYQFGNSGLFEQGSPFTVAAGYLYNPCGCFIDRAATPYPLLYICDLGNNRILVYQWRGLSDWTTNSRSLSPYAIVGQSDAGRAAGNGDQNAQDFPTYPTPTSTTLMFCGWWELSPVESGSGTGFSVDASGNLHFVDPANNRTLSMPRGGGTFANVFGQPNYTSWKRNRGNYTNGNNGAVASNGLYTSAWGTSNASFAPKVYVDTAGNRWITDSVNWRVLRVPSGGSSANLVLGKPNLSSSPINGNDSAELSASLDALGPPASVLVNAARTKVWVCDMAVSGALPTRHRILVFSAGGGAPDNFAIGQAGVALPKIFSGASMTIGGAGSLTLTDASNPGWKINCFVGKTLTVGASTGTITANTSNSITVSSWTGGVPASGTAYQLPWVRPTTLDWDTIDQGGGVFYIWISDNNDGLIYLVDGDTGEIKGSKGGGTFFGDGAAIGGSVGVDASGNLFVTCQRGGNQHDVLYFARADNRDVYTRLFRPDLGAGGVGPPNKLDHVGMMSPNSIAATSSQIIVGQWQRILFWNKPAFVNGEPADGFLNVDDARTLSIDQLFANFETSVMDLCVDGNGQNLWVVTTEDSSQNVLHRYTLPLVSGQRPAQHIKFDLTDLEGNTITNGIGAHGYYEGHFGMCANADSTELWLTQRQGNRVIRIRNPMTNPKVDCVLGQPNSSSTTPNTGGKSAYTMSSPGRLRLDSVGNLYVADDTYEVDGNFRLLIFLASTIPSGQAATIHSVPGVSGGANYIKDGIAFFNHCFAPDGSLVCSFNPYGPDPDTNDPAMVQASYDTGRGIHGRFIGVFTSPLSVGTVPDFYFQDFGSWWDGMTFDPEGNFYAADNNRGRVLIYLTPFLVVAPPPPPIIIPAMPEDQVLAGVGTPVRWAFSYWKSSLDMQRIEDISPYVIDASIDMDTTRAIKKHLSMRVRHTGALNLFSDYVLVSAIAKGADGIEHAYSLGLFDIDFPKQRYEPGHAELDVDGYDPCVRLAYSQTTTPFIMLAGMNIVSNVITILQGQGLFRISIPPSSATMGSDATWDVGTPWLQIVTDLLEMAGYYAPWIDTAGYVVSRPYDDIANLGASVTYTTDAQSLVLPLVETSVDASKFANQVIVVPDSPDLTFSSIKTNNDPTSPVSTVALGYTKTQLVRAKVADQAAADARATIELQVASALHQIATLTTTLDPRRGVHEVYAIAIYDDASLPYLEGNWWCQGWSMDLSAGGKMKHSLAKVVNV